MRLGEYFHHSPKPRRDEYYPSFSVSSEKLPSIAIVTPSFNQGIFLERTLRSVLDQNYPKLEYAVMDGGSTDNSVSIIKAHSPRLKAWQSAPDKGQTDAIVKGFEKVTGDVMAYLNSDDELMPGSLRFIGEFLAQHPEVDVVYGHRIIIDEHNQEVGRWVLPKHCRETIRYIDFIPQETLFWRKSIYDKVGGLDSSFRFAMDWDLLLRFTRANAHIVRLPYYLGCFRAHEQQKSQTIHNSVGSLESQLLMKREHGDAYDHKRQERLYWKYKRDATISCLLLDRGIRM